jgi:hypothetical protein
LKQAEVFIGLGEPDLALERHHALEHGHRRRDVHGRMEAAVQTSA